MRGMATPRRTGTETSKTRALLLDITERLMLEEGYAAVGIRRVAREAGVAPALVHYYFHTLDDLFIAALRRSAEQEFERFARALSSEHPLRDLWAYSSDPTGAAMTMEFIALANHRKAIRNQIASYAEQLRNLQIEAVTSRMTDYGTNPNETPLAAIVVLITSTAQNAALEKALGITTGHAETFALIERYLQQFDGAPPAI